MVLLKPLEQYTAKRNIDLPSSYIFVEETYQTMKHRIIFISALLSIFLIQGCTSVTEIENEYSPKHLRIQYANISIIPPNGMNLNPVGSGFANEWSHLKMEQISKSIDDIAAVFGDSVLDGNDLVKLSEEQMKINGFRALKVLLDDNQRGKTYKRSVLIIGDEENTVIVSGTYPSDSIVMGENINNSLKTVIYEKDRAISDQSVFFDFNLNDSSLQVAEVTNIGTLLTPTGSPNLYDVDVFMGATVELVEVNSTQWLPYVKARIGYTAESDSTEYRIREFNKNDLKGFETIHINDRRMMFVTFLFGNGRLYRFGGASKSDYLENEMEFRTLVENCQILQ
jgi:hypothetical protein